MIFMLIQLLHIHLNRMKIFSNRKALSLILVGVLVSISELTMHSQWCS